MKKPRTRLRGLRCLSLFLILTFAGSIPSSLAAIDNAINLTVWKLVYGLTDAQVNDSAWMASDTDDDGESNEQELIAGTNPLQASSRMAVTGQSSDGSAVYFNFPTAKLKLYRLESANSLDNPAWTPLQPPVQVIGNGGTQTLSVPQGSGRTTESVIIYRVVATDLDTDNDGVSDWAEVTVGYDPNNSHTKNSPVDDHTSLTAELVKENVVTVISTEPATTQPADAVTAPTALGSVTVTRAGTLNFSAITVGLTKGGTAVQDTDYTALPDSILMPAKVGSVKIPVTPKYNPSRLSNATVTLQAKAGGGYTISSPSSASVVIYPAGNATGTGLTGYYYNNTSTTIGAGYSQNLFLPANLKATRTDAKVDFLFNTAGVLPTGVNNTYFTVRWAGQVQPQYSETYYFVTKTDDGVKLWVNGQLLVDKWVSQSATEWTGAIDLKAGVRYDIKMEYYFGNSGSREAHLSWYSDNQVKEIVPTSRLYPATGTSAAPSMTNSLTVYGFVNQPFNFTATASNSANLATTFALVANSGALPPGLSLNASTGLISGTPTQAGTYQIALMATSSLGTGSSVLTIQIIDTGNAITRDIWTSGLTGATVADIPVSLAPNSSDNSLSRLEDTTAYADNTASRLRGYFTAPTTGNYYFWVAASSAAELWISNDGEPVNKLRRAYVTGAGTSLETWNTEPNQKSAWLAMTAGRRYYFEVLHNHAVGTPNDHLSVAWFLDPTGTTANPVANNTGVVPGYLLSPYVAPTASNDTGTLYATNMAPQGTALTTAVGSASLRLSADETQAILRFQYSGLSSPRTAYHVHMEDFGSQPSQIIYDIDDADRFHPELRTADGGYIWNIAGVGGTSAADIVNIIKQGKAYINIHTVNYGPGEIRGNFGRVQGSQTAPTVQTDPGYDTSNYSTDAGAARFLNQATFGASPNDVAYVKANGYSAWLDNQFAQPVGRLVPEVQANVSSDPTNLYPTQLMFSAWWKKSVTSPDQLRQRVAFALSEILVVSDTGPLNGNGLVLADYYDTLLDNAFGNFREILEQVTLTPAMGIYLDMRGNQKGNLTTGLHPNENYGREILQLFSIGLNRLWPDGTLALDSNGNLIPTYDQKVIEGVARVMTGWNYGQPLVGGRLPTNFSPTANYLDPMTLVPTRHELGSKLVLDNVVLPAAVGYSLTSAPIAGSEADPNVVAFDNYCLQDLEKVLDNIFNNASIGPFICRQLIQRLVTSSPSPAYLHRVVQKFNDDGSAQHVRGNMQAVIRAILLDGEARSTTLPAAMANTFGKQREPLLRITGPARAFPAPSTTGTYSQTGSTTLTITTTTPHLLSSGNAVFLDFTGNTPIPFDNPTSQSYSVLSSPAPTTFTFAVTPTGLLATTYTQAANSNTITINNAGPQVVGAKLYLDFVSGGAPDGIYTVASLPDSSHFTVTTNEDPATVPARSAAVIIPRLTAGEMVRNSGTPVTSTITVSTFGNHNLQVNDHVWLDFAVASGSVNPDGEFIVSSILDEDHFTIVVPNSTLTRETINTSTLYMLVPPPLIRSGNMRFEESKYDVGYNSNNDLAQTPLNSPTVFNFFYPDYKYPGPLAANNITVPEFQLTTDTNVVTLTNSIAGAILASGNTNGLTSYRSGGGSITMDLSPYMTAAQTASTSLGAATGTGSLVDRLGNLLTGGQLTTSTKTTILTFVNSTTNFPYTTTGSGPTLTQMRDRVRAIVHLIVTSPEYAIQR